MTDAPAIEFSGVTKDYASGWSGFRLRALDDLTLAIPRGQVVGLLGPNGSGKSTAIKLVLGLLAPTLGQIRVFGLPAGTMAARRVTGYLPEAPDFQRYLSGRELLRFHGQLCGLDRARIDERIAGLLTLVALEFAADRRVGTYSKGMLQRIGLAQALIHDPKLLILDEPTAGVDPEGAAAMGELILKLRSAGKTILITSHLLDQMEDVCDRVAILDRGRLLCDSPVADLLEFPAQEQATRCDESLTANATSDLGTWVSDRRGAVRTAPRARRRLDDVFLATIRSHRE